jgi:tetratricopeptide (TPR) repeat protein
MHAIQTLFTEGQRLFARGQFDKAFVAFEQCTQIMPTLSAAWENMAVCLANQGLDQTAIQSHLLKMAPPKTHDSIISKINTLIIPNQTTAIKEHTYIALLQQEQLQAAVDNFNAEWLTGSVNEEQAVQFLRGLFIAHEHSAKKQGQLYLPALLNSGTGPLHVHQL